MNLTAACNTGAHQLCNHTPCDCTCHDPEVIIHRAIVEWNNIEGGPKDKPGEPSLAHYIAAALSAQPHRPENEHRHCDSDPIECWVRAMEGEYAERGRKIELLTDALRGSEDAPDSEERPESETVVEQFAREHPQEWADAKASLGAPDSDERVRLENERLRELIGYFGLKVVDGDFTLKSGRKSSLILVPVDGQRLLKLAGQAFAAALTRPDTDQEGA